MKLSKKTAKCDYILGKNIVNLISDRLDSILSNVDTFFVKYTLTLNGFDLNYILANQKEATYKKFKHFFVKTEPGDGILNSVGECVTQVELASDVWRGDDHHEDIVL